jgi:FKBP-type peptidyl-prolyl cis-trans isomerase FklB
MKSCITITLNLIALGLSTSLIADNRSGIQTDKQKFSYTIGYQIGGQLAEQIRVGALDIDHDAFVQAISDAVADQPPVLTVEEMENSLKKHQVREEANKSAAAESGRSRGQIFQDEYSNREDVLATGSGLQYRVLQEGNGRSPESTDTVVVHYIGRLIDGNVFDSSRDRGNPATFSLGGIIPGWQEVLQLMVEGDIWEVVIPTGLAYGVQGAGASIGPNETLIFEIELIMVK